MPEYKDPYILPPTDPSTSSKPATFIFLHGYGDDAQGLPLGLGQQFQFHNKLPYLKWLLPNAPIHPEARTNAWYLPKALPNAMKPRVPGEIEDDSSAPDDEAGILESVAYVDSLVRKEIESGVDGKRIVVGGFSQGCVVSLAYGLLGETRDEVGGIVGLSGYFALADRIEALKKERGLETEKKEEGQKKYFFIHGSKDMMVPLRLFEYGKKELGRWVEEKDVEVHTYEGMGHSTSNALLRDLLFYLGRVVPQ